MSGRGRGRGRGRGAFYKARYGNRSEGKHTNPVSSNNLQQSPEPQDRDAQGSTARTFKTLRSDLNSIDSQQYGAYNRLRGSYFHESHNFTLHVDHIQGDAYSTPSRVRVNIAWEDAGFPDEYRESDVKMIALTDFLSRAAADFIGERHMSDSITGSGGGWSGPKGGAFTINSPGQEILPRTSAMVIDSPAGYIIELRFTVSLPARGRTVLGKEAHTILGENLPALVKGVCFYESLDTRKLERHIESAVNQQHMRSQLNAKNLVAFVANGAVLPRASGASQRPLDTKNVIRFCSPPELEVTLSRVHGSDVRGMGIARGITLLTGGGYHGKSTLLEALELGVYNHIPGDGREFVVTEENAVKIRAEDGRAVTGSDITPFIKNLPGGKDTVMFTTDDASGSTSMAASIQEALEVGCQTLMIDEDSSATNLLVRDERMQALIRSEPITPLVSKVRALYQEYGVSTIIVVGGLGDWLSVADKVVGMESYSPHDLTNKARDLVNKLPRQVNQHEDYGALPSRCIQLPTSITLSKSPWSKLKDFIILPAPLPSTKHASEADAGIDISALDQIVELGQTKLIAQQLPGLAKLDSPRDDLSKIMRQFDSRINIKKRLPSSLIGGDFVAVRQFEMSAAISRLRGSKASPGAAAFPLHKRARTECTDWVKG